MIQKPIFTGAATALITPTTPDGVDYEAMGRLIDWQIEKGIDALVIAGSTGEGKTLTIAEHREVLRYSAERIAGRVPMIAGTGSNETSVSISMSKYACEVGADGLLVVTPYYIKATQNGLVKMYSMIADAVTKPVIIYNVPSRTGVNVEPETYARLADHGNIAAIKEANGNISKIVEAAALVGGKLDIYSGNDDQIVPILSMGVSGRRRKFSHQPMAAMAALHGMGFTSLNSARIRGMYFSCSAVAPAVSPSKYRWHIREVSDGSRLLSTLITPLPPMDRIGRIWSSLPE